MDSEFEAVEKAQKTYNDLSNEKKALQTLLEKTVKEAGTFRSKGAGVYAGEQLIHAGTPAIP